MSERNAEDVGESAVLKCKPRFAKGASGRDDIINKDDGRIFLERALRNCKGAHNIPFTFGSVLERSLGSGIASAHQKGSNFKISGALHLFGNAHHLIKPTFAFPPPRERQRHNIQTLLGVEGGVIGRFLHKVASKDFAKEPRNAPVALVFEHPNHVPDQGISVGKERKHPSLFNDCKFLRQLRQSKRADVTLQSLSRKEEVENMGGDARKNTHVITHPVRLGLIFTIIECMENPLTAVKDFLRSFVGGTDGDSILGIDIGSSSIKVVQLKKKRGVAVLETYGELALGPYAGMEVGRATNLPTGKLSEALIDIMREANVTARSCGISIPFGASLISIMELPATEKKQLAQMIPIEARKYIPVPITEVTLDWFIIPENENKYLSQDDEEKEKNAARPKTSVLLVAIHNETLNKYREVTQKANLSVSFYEIEIFSAIRASLGQGIEPTMIIDIGAATTKVYVVEFGIVRTSHIINKGSQDMSLAISRSMSLSVDHAERLKREQGLTESGDAKVREAILLTLEYIFSEANRVLLNYQRKYNRNVNRAVFTGGGSVLKGLAVEAKGRLSTEVILADPFSKTQAPAFLEKVLTEVGPEFSVAVGVALRKLQEIE